MEEQVDLEEALRHIPRLYRRILLAYAQGWSMRESARQAGMRPHNRTFYHAEQALLKELFDDAA